jgi:hypothetical protein
MRDPDAAQVRAALISPACRRAVADGDVGQIVRTVRKALNRTYLILNLALVADLRDWHPTCADV